MITPVLMRALALSLGLLWGGFVLAPSAEAQGVYRYVEKNGTVVYTNVPPPGVKAHQLKGTGHRDNGKRVANKQKKPKGTPVQKLTPEEFDEHIRVSAKRYNIPEPLLWAVMHAESNFNARAISKKGASGLMQLMPATAQQMYVKNIFDIKENIEGGARYLRLLANMYDGDMVKMVAAYNAGPDAVKKYKGEVPPYAETQAYVRKVVALYFDYKDRLLQASAGN
jgi:hypothetical protein